MVVLDAVDLAAAGLVEAASAAVAGVDSALAVAVILAAVAPLEAGDK